MAQVQCSDCGTTFDGSWPNCPNCGCPTSACSPEGYLPVRYDYDSGKTDYYYVDFSWFERFTSDPWLLTALMNIGLLKWLFAPWHIGDDEDEENFNKSYEIANDIFFILNRSWKLITYPSVWVFFKLLPVYLILIALIFGGLFTDDSEVIDIMGALSTVVFVVMLIFSLWLYIIAFGKSCKRYFVPMIGAFRHIIVVLSRTVKDNL